MTANQPFPLIKTPTFQLPDGAQPDMLHRCASEMACVHNMMLRGLNSIYQQAPHIKPEDANSFTRYSMCFYNLLHVHHNGEEEILFPCIEEMTGESGIMSRNIEQHQSFHSGLETYKSYLDACISGKEKYVGSKLVQIIDSFGHDLAAHLADEIPTILDLKKYGDTALKGFEKKFEDWANKDVAQLSVAETLTWGFFNHDREYEGGLWKNWPPAPGPVVFIVRWVTYWSHTDWWKFASCDRYGKPRGQLYATSQ